MSSRPVPAEQTARHTAQTLAVPLTMETVRAAMPLIRALLLATVVTVLIMIGLPTLLAAAAATP